MSDNEVYDETSCDHCSLSSQFHFRPSFVNAEAGAKVLQMMSEWSLNEAPIRSRTGIRQVQ